MLGCVPYGFGLLYFALIARSQTFHVYPDHCHGIICNYTCHMVYTESNRMINSQCEGSSCWCTLRDTCSDSADCEESCREDWVTARQKCDQNHCSCNPKPKCLETLCGLMCKITYPNKTNVAGVCEDGCRCKMEDGMSFSTTLWLIAGLAILFLVSLVIAICFFQPTKAMPETARAPYPAPMPPGAATYAYAAPGAMMYPSAPYPAPQGFYQPGAGINGYQVQPPPVTGAAMYPPAPYPAPQGYYQQGENMHGYQGQQPPVPEAKMMPMAPNRPQ